MSGSVTIITGGTKGLGRALALEFGRAHHRVYALYHADDAAAEALRTEFARDGIAGHCLKQDITKEFTLPEDALRAGGLTLIHAAAAPFAPHAFQAWALDEFQAQMDTAVIGAFHAFRSVLKPMVSAKRGTFITVLTHALASSPKGFSGYLTAKAALRGLMPALANEYAARGIRFFSVSPGFMETDLTRSWPAQALVAMASAEGTTTPETAAREIFHLHQSECAPGLGEDYAISAAPAPKALDDPEAHRPGQLAYRIWHL